MEEFLSTDISTLVDQLILQTSPRLMRMTVHTMADGMHLS